MPTLFNAKVSAYPSSVSKTTQAYQFSLKQSRTAGIRQKLVIRDKITTLKVYAVEQDMIWKPNTTVAAIVHQDGKFLMVEEDTADGLRINQPAGHLEQGETLFDAVQRETLEETAYHFEPTELLGIYHWQRPDRDITYLRFAFVGTLGEHDAGRALDTGIIRALWMTRAELAASQHLHRSPQVLRCVDDYLAGQRYPLALIHHLV